MKSAEYEVTRKGRLNGYLSRFVITYLSLTEKAWAQRIRGSADILVRKPYGVVDVDRAIRRINGIDDN